MNVDWSNVISNKIVKDICGYHEKVEVLIDAVEKLVGD